VNVSVNATSALSFPTCALLSVLGVFAAHRLVHSLRGCRFCFDRACQYARSCASPPVHPAGGACKFHRM